jgi:hypothetical protein
MTNTTIATMTTIATTMRIQTMAVTLTPSSNLSRASLLVAVDNDNAIHGTR